MAKGKIKSMRTANQRKKSAKRADVLGEGCLLPREARKFDTISSLKYNVVVCVVLFSQQKC